MSRMRPRIGLLSRLAGLVSLGRKNEPAPPTAVVAQAANQDLTDDSFRLALDQMVQDEEGRHQTKLQIISLVEFREAV
ncbi:MAG TPA: hypothetical protein VLL76_01370, partial [Candidatus Omnitrophota bacterium]|nr:hypothetical protein [Candidatus Omnitrophota bacterium]